MYGTISYVPLLIQWQTLIDLIIFCSSIGVFVRNVNHLSGALEYRCCREIAQASQKLTFDGSIERVSCITNHDDFSMTNRSVLLQVGPLLRDKNGRGYRRRDGQTETQ